MCTNIVQRPILLHDEKKSQLRLSLIQFLFNKSDKEYVRTLKSNWTIHREKPRESGRADAFSRGSPVEMESLLEGNHSIIFQSLVFLGLYPMIWAWDYLPPEVVHPVTAQ